ncbi:radical SAM protein [Paucidesulfovibrio longus]|uniref:radical SAM protein n=1 Tax=Paucidesulfovibrio longus TaxID=889 RepID=UPI0003B45B7C|nr:radical SAM protein [Paucidesulfovibrio longus]
MNPPTHLYFNTTNRCNYRCTYCTFHSPIWKPELGAPGFTLGLEDFRRELDLLEEGAGDHRFEQITFTGMGEPMLNPDILGLIALVKERGYTCALISNFSRLLTPHIDALMDLGLDGLYTNLDSGVASHYEELRRGAKFETTLANIRAAARTAARKNPGLNFEVHNLVTPESVDLIPGFIDTVAEAGVRKVVIKTFVNFLDVDAGDRFFTHLDAQRDFFAAVARAKEYGRERGVRVNAPAYAEVLSGAREYRADDPDLRCGIGSGLHLNFGPLELGEEDLLGNVLHCCPVMRREEHRSYGNILRDPLERILAHPARVRLLEGNARGEIVHPECRSCEYCLLGLHELHAAPQEAAS